MEGNYPPGFYLPEREQQENRQQQPPQQQPQPSQQQHVAHYPFDLPIPYHTPSQHQADYMEDQPTRVFPLPHPGTVTQMFTPVYHDSGHSSANHLHHTLPQRPIAYGGHGVKYPGLQGNFTPPLTTQEPVVERSSMAVTTREPVAETTNLPTTTLGSASTNRDISPIPLIPLTATHEILESNIPPTTANSIPATTTSGSVTSSSSDVTMITKIRGTAEEKHIRLVPTRKQPLEGATSQDHVQCYNAIFNCSFDILHFVLDAQKFHCSQCEHLFASPKVILRHIKCEHTHSKPGSQSNEMIPVLSWRKKRKSNNSTKTEITNKLHSTTKNEINQDEQVFTCETCGKVFPTRGRLMAHKLFHEYNQEHACPVCGKGQGNTQALARHLTTHEPKLYKCKKCARQFKAETSLDKHMREAHGFRCQFCLELFTRKSKCLEHEQTHQAFKSGQPESNGISPDESEPSQAATQEAKDMLGKTTTYYQKKRPYKCRFCPRRYTSCFSARDHEKENHTNEGTYKCIHCPKVFTSEHRLKNHLISHEQKGFYQCTLCPKSFGSEKALNNHQGEHTGLKPFKCEICGRGFRVKSHFHAHKRRMHQERPLRFFCSVCSKGFADKGNLVKHERRHKGIRPFVCLECGKGFTARTSLDTHMQIIHTKEKRFCCEVCGKKFSLNNHYTHHMIKHKMQGDADA
nr:zinc finger protein 737-like [Lytechinus pictus]